MDRRREEPSIRVSRVLTLEEGRRTLTQSVVIRLHEVGLDNELMENLRQVLAAHPGTVPIFIELVSRTHGRTTLRAGDDLRVSADAAFQRDVANLLGDGHVGLTANGHGHLARV